MDGGGVNGELGGIENKELSVRNDVDGDFDGAGEFTGGEVGL